MKKELVKSVGKLTKSQMGFSLVEILVALTLLGIAGTFVATKIFDQLLNGQIDSARIQMQSLGKVLKEYRRKCRYYPTTDQGLQALVAKPTSGKECKNYPPGGFLEDGNVPMDPWDAEYVYESDGKNFNIYSYGPDNEEGGEGTDADIYLKEKNDKTGG